MKRFHLFLWFIIGLIFFTACGTQSIENNEPLIESTELPPDPADLPVPKAVSIFGADTFTMDLPEGWDVSSETIIVDESSSYDLFLLGDNPTSSGGPGISKVIVANAADWTPQTLAATQCSTCPENPFESVTLGGKSALRTQIGGGGVPIMITWYFVENKGNLIGLAIHNLQTLEPMDDVLQSIQFD